MISSTTKPNSIIQTVGDLCKVCYTCVRDCPAKAIRIVGGQAQIIPERCITCGNCVKVCRQNAKCYVNSVPETIELLNEQTNKEKVAIVAPSFPAEFHDLKTSQFVAILRKCGFTKVCQVAYGADLVAKEYQKIISENKVHGIIASTCPAIVSYIEKYQPEVLKFLAPICSPMVASARIAKEKFGKDAKIVFIGPCIAKKNEALRYPDEINAVLTFEELRKIFAIMEIKVEDFADSNDDFDPPHPGFGMLFPISRGLLQAANINEDLLSQNVVATDGKHNFVPAIEEFSSGELQTKLLELLCCKGCINGPGTCAEISQYKKRKLVSEYATKKINKQSNEDNSKISLTPIYHPNDVRTQKPDNEKIKEILAKMGKTRPEDELDCGACGYPSCRDHAVAIINGLAESEMCLPYVIEKLKKSLGDLSFSNNQLEKTKQALINAEKLASMGQLSAGIAHEINNPLGIILLNASLILESIPQNSENYEDMKLIVEQAEQCKKIVTGLLNFARKNKVLFQDVNIPEFISERCLKAIIRPDKINIEFENLANDPNAEIDPDQMVQVMTNLIVNAIEAMPNEGKIIVSFKDTQSEIRISVKDEGTGIPKEHLNKIFEPFFTTKQMGKGTGLGLAVTYGIIKMHKGRIEVSSNCDQTKGKTGTTFTIIIPRKAKQY